MKKAPASILVSTTVDRWQLYLGMLRSTELPASISSQQWKVDLDRL
jgi:hypothetical protein